MAQSATTVTAPNPSPPTNMVMCGTSGPNPPNFTKVQYANPFNLTAQASGANGTSLVGDARPQSPYGVNPSPPPYFDDGTAAAAIAFAANKAALAGGTGATSGGTENTYPGTDTAPFDTPNMIGAVPAATSAAHEGTGIESVATQTYATGTLVPGSAATFQPTGQTPAWAAGDPGGPLRTAGVTPALTPGTMPTPNASHASSLSPLTNPTLSSISPTTATSGASGTDTITFTGVGFISGHSIAYVLHGNATVPVRLATTFVSSTSLTAPVPKRTAAGASVVFVVTDGVVQTVDKTITYS